MENGVTSAPAILTARRLWDSVMEGTQGRLARGVSWSLLGTMSSGALNVLLSIALARTLGSTQFGAYGLISTTLVTFSVFAGPALGLTATKHLAGLRTTDRLRAARILRLTTAITYTLALAASLSVWAAAQYIATGPLHAPSLVTEVRLAAIALLFYAINGCQTGALAGLEAFKAVSGANILRGVSTFAACSIGARMSGLTGAVGGLAVSAVITATWTSIALRRHVRASLLPSPRIGEIWTEWPVLCKFTLPTFLGVVLVMTAQWLSNVILVHAPNGYDQMAILTVANQWRLTVFFLPTVMVQPFISVLSNLAGTGALSECRRAIRLSLLSATLSAALPGIVVIGLAGRICGFYGPGFRAGVASLALYIFGCILSAPTLAIVQAIAAMGNQWQSCALNLIWAAAFLTGTAMFVSKGAMGISMAFVAANSLHLITNWMVMRDIFIRLKNDHVMLVDIGEPQRATA